MTKRFQKIISVHVNLSVYVEGLQSLTISLVLTLSHTKMGQGGVSVQTNIENFICRKPQSSRFSL